MEFLKAHQLSIMLFMSGICGVLVILTLMTNTLSMRRRRILAMLEAAAMFLMLFDRYAYLYRGNPSTRGFWMVRISNFLVFFLTLFILHSITRYLFDLFRDGNFVTPLPKRLYICEVLYGLGLGLPLCKRHVTSLGGDIIHDASYQKGCRFIVESPIN